MTMKSKDEILDQARDLITNPNHTGKRPLWLELKHLEVMIDIRDILDKTMLELYRGLRAMSKRD